MLMWHIIDHSTHIFHEILEETFWSPKFMGWMGGIRCLGKSPCPSSNLVYNVKRRYVCDGWHLYSF